MKNKIHKILGVGLTLMLALGLVAGFALPVAAAETINEWYEFDYMVEGEDGDWFYDPTIGSVGPVAEAINEDLYAAVSFGQGAFFDVYDDNSNYMYIEDLYPNTGIITAHIEGEFSLFNVDGAPEFFNWAARWSFDDGPIEGWVYAWGSIIEGAGSPDLLVYTGYIVGDFIDDVMLDITDGYFYLSPTGKLIGSYEFFDDFWIDFSGDYKLGGSLLKSTDGGRTWEKTGYEDVDLDPSTTDTIEPPGPVVDMVCSSIDEDIIYVTDGNYVYKSVDGGDEFNLVARDSLEEALVGECGYPVRFSPITSIDVGYDDDDNPFVFIGTRPHWSLFTMGVVEGSVYWIGEAGYPATWTDLNLPCYRGGGYEALAVACAPDWAESKKTYVVVSGTGYNTYVISTIGVTCSWTEVAELEYDCLYSFGSLFASRIGFPDDYEDTETLFVGVVDEFPCVANDGLYPPIDEQGGDVYFVTDGSAIDMNVAGITSGCIGIESVDILSLDVMGDTDEASLIAGAFCDTNVYYSYDGGWDWDASAKDPTGSYATYALWYGDSALAATACCEAALSLSCGEEVGEFWNQISLISTDIDEVRYIDHSPEYLSADSETMFMVTRRNFVRGARCGATVSLFRYDGTYWERVFLNTTYEASSDPRWAVHVSPDFLNTECLYLGNHYFEIFRSVDAGCSWDQLTFPCSPRPEISATVVIDEDTVIVGGRDADEGWVFKTTRHGARPWDDYEYEATDQGDVMSFALEPGYEDPGSILLGDSRSRVYISEDGGEEWDLVGDCAAVLDLGDNYYYTWVVFDPEYDANNTIFAAAGNVIARCIIDPDADWADQEWVDINTLDPENGETFWGIHAIGDTALYVGSYTEVEHDEPPYDGGVFRSLNPLEADEADVVFERLWEGLDVENGGPDGSWLRCLWVTSDTSDEGCAENVLWALEPRQRPSPNPQNVWVYEDTLAAPVVLDMPLDGQKLGTTDSATLSWNELCGADCYEVALYKYCPECPEEKIDVDISDLMDCHEVCIFDHRDCTYECTEDICIVVDGLESGTTYYWQVRVCEGEPKLSKWSEERSFMTALVAVPFAELCSPPCGDQDIILTPNFSWEAVDGATGYDIELATTETFTAGVIRGSSTVNAWVLSAPLDYATTYYWRVRAEKNGVYSDWTICLFTTMEAPVPAPPPVVVEPTPPAPVVPTPIIELPLTPSWVWAIIAIGTALVVVVIVLTVRTRRPPA